ncbi:hypothetical protein M422DRAFT_243506 [Sphaerobolus stellatus SS14]|nr:hypothetical protein M422DRAFT_243506 [Sphaerobolus stellatus SS14]
MFETLTSEPASFYGSFVPAIVPSSNVVAASVVIFYDYVLCLDDEIQVIWKAKPSWVTWLYFFVRYYTILLRFVHLVFCSVVFGIPHLTLSGCVVWGWFQVMTGQILFIAVEVLLIARVFAYYARSKVVLVGLLGLLGANIAAAGLLVGLALQEKNLELSDNAIFHSGPCIGHSISNRYSSVWILPLSIHCFIFILVVARYLKTRSSHSPRFMSIFVYDHVWVFIAVLAVSIWSIIAWRKPGANGQISLTWNYSVLGYCGSRLILSLRTASELKSKQSLAEPVSDIKFNKMKTVDVSSGSDQTSSQ